MKRSDHTWYWLALALATALALVYIEQRGLQGRYATYRQTMQTVEVQQQQVESLRETLASEEKRAADMSSDPLEQEANIRSVKHLVREGEIIFRLEERQ